MCCTWSSYARVYVCMDVCVRDIRNPTLKAEVLGRINEAPAKKMKQRKRFIRREDEGGSRKRRRT